MLAPLTFSNFNMNSAAAGDICPAPRAGHVNSIGRIIRRLQARGNLTNSTTTCTTNYVSNGQYRLSRRLANECLRIYESRPNTIGISKTSDSNAEAKSDYRDLYNSGHADWEY